jgi:glycosyltransferase involved in cell wall biosynthesis
MAYGAALISSGRGGLREVTADAAVTVSDLAADKIAQDITILTRNSQERERLQKAGRERASYFSIAERTKLLDNVRTQVLAET